ncbi:MAG: Gfo/Idh/MocA family protein [Armatimonadota bacterium]
MLRMGIIGAENSHAGAISHIINVEQAIPDMAVTHIWGETKAFAQAAAEKGQIPTIVRDPLQMLGEIDCLMVDHRHGKFHLAAAAPFVDAGIPCFIDKPFCTSVKEGKWFLARRREKAVAVTTFSAISQQSCVAGIKEEIAKLGKLRVAQIFGPGDWKGKYGGIFFYGIHCVDLMTELFGPGVETVGAATNGKTCSLICRYPDELNVLITTHAAGPGGWVLTVTGEHGTWHTPVSMDENGYLPGTRRFVEMFRTGIEPYDDARMLAPISVLEAAAASIKLKKRVKTAAVAVPAAVG